MRRSSLCLLIALSLLGCRSPEPKEEGEVPPYPWATQSWRASIRKRLHETLVTQSYEGVALERVLEDIARRARVNVRPDPELFREPKLDLEVIHVRLRDCPADEAFDAVLLPLGLAWTLRDEFVYVAKPEDLPVAQEKEDVAERILRARQAHDTYSQRKAAQARLEKLALQVDYDNTPLESVLEDLSRRARVPIRFDRQGLAPPKGSPGVTIKGLSEVRAVSLLSLLLAEHGLGYIWRGAEVRVVPLAEADLAARRDAMDEQLARKRVTLTVAKVALRDLASALQEAAQVPVFLDEATWARRDLASIELTDVELREALRRITDEAKCATILMEGTIFFLTPTE